MAAGVPANLERVNISHCPTAPANSVDPPPGSQQGFSVDCESVPPAPFADRTAAIISAWCQAENHVCTVPWYFRGCLCEQDSLRCPALVCLLYSAQTARICSASIYPACLQILVPAIGLALEASPNLMVPWPTFRAMTPGKQHKALHFLCCVAGGCDPSSVSNLQVPNSCCQPKQAKPLPCTAAASSVSENDHTERKAAATALRCNSGTIWFHASESALCQTRHKYYSLRCLYLGEWQTPVLHLCSAPRQPFHFLLIYTSLEISAETTAGLLAMSRLECRPAEACRHLGLTRQYGTEWLRALLVPAGPLGSLHRRRGSQRASLDMGS